MTTGDGNMIGLFAGGGIFCWLLVALMLAYIRRQQRSTGPMQYDEDLQDQTDQLMLARATLDEVHQTSQLKLYEVIPELREQLAE